METETADYLNKVIESVEPISKNEYDKPIRRFGQIAIPSGSLGKFEGLSIRIAAIQGLENLKIKNKVVFVFAGDHGVTEEGISAFPKEVTVQMVKNFVKGGAGVNLFARYYGVDVEVVDIGVAEKFESNNGLIARKVGFGTENIRKGPAMTRKEAINSLTVGIQLAFEWADKKETHIFGTGDMGIGNTTPSAAILSVLADKDPEEVTGRGTGIDDKTLELKKRVIKDAIHINRPDPEDPIDVLSKVGGFEIGGIAGLIIGAAAKRKAVVVDGFISGAAALLALKLNKNIKDYLFVSHLSREEGHKLFYNYIEDEPLFDFGMRLGEGTGSVVGIGMVELASKMLTEMTTFSSAEVTKGCSKSY